MPRHYEGTRAQGEALQIANCGCCARANRRDAFVGKKRAVAADFVHAQEVSDVDPALREFLREWRREIAKEQNVPAYVVMHDTTLDEICRARPGSIGGLLQITGIGERKAELYGRPILDALKQFSGGARAAAPDKKITPSEHTIQLIEEGKTLDEVAEIRGAAGAPPLSTWCPDLVERGLLEFDDDWVPEDRQQQIEAAAANLGLERMTPIKEVLPPDFTYDEIRFKWSQSCGGAETTDPVKSIAAAT